MPVGWLTWLTIWNLLCLWCLNNAAAQEALPNARCNHWPDRGTCDREFQVKWYYDRYDHRCRRFYFGGCEGNSNKFDTLEECSTHCPYNGPEATWKNRCLQPHDPGHCFADIERWFFDERKQQCVCRYTWWSGCGGNSNMYYSYNHCMLICGQYAKNGPGIDENYWGKKNKSTISWDSHRVLTQPPNRVEDGFYSIRVPRENVILLSQYSTARTNLVNISHSDDGPMTPATLFPGQTNSWGTWRYIQSGSQHVYRYDSNPRQLNSGLLEEIDSTKQRSLPRKKIGMVTSTEIPPSLRRRLKDIQKKKLPPRIIQAAALGTNLPQRVQHRQKQTVLYKVTKEHPNVDQQFQHHLQNHEVQLKRSLEMRFPGYLITLYPEVETNVRPNGQQTVRQRIRWTAHPRTTSFQGPTKMDTLEQPVNIVPTNRAMEQHQLDHLSLMKNKEQNQQQPYYQLYQKPHSQDFTKQPQQPQKEQMYLVDSAHHTYSKPEGKQLSPSQNQKRIQQIEIVHSSPRNQSTKMLTAPNSLETSVKREKSQIVNSTHAPIDVDAAPESYKATADVIETIRPRVESVTPAPISFDEIIAFDEALSSTNMDDESDYEIFEHFSSPKLATSAAPPKAVRVESPPAQNSILPIVFPASAASAKVQPTDELKDYAQMIDFNDDD